MIAALNRVSLPPVALGVSALMVPVLAAFVIARLPVSNSVLLVAGLIVLLIGLLHIRLTIYMMIFSMLLSPELGIGVVAGDRPVTIRFEDILLILIGVAWVARAVYRKDVGLFRDSPLNRPIFAYSAAAVIATLVSGWSHDINWLRALLFLAKYLEYFVLYFLVLNNLRGRDDIRNYLVAAFVTCAIVSVMCISQIPAGGRVTAPFEGAEGEPNTLGGYLVFMLALASGFYFTASSTRERVIWLGFAALATLPLLYTLSRSSWLARSWWSCCFGGYQEKASCSPRVLSSWPSRPFSCPTRWLKGWSTPLGSRPSRDRFRWVGRGWTRLYRPGSTVGNTAYVAGHKNLSSATGSQATASWTLSTSGSSRKPASWALLPLPGWRSASSVWRDTACTTQRTGSPRRFHWAT